MFQYFGLSFSKPKYGHNSAFGSDKIKHKWDARVTRVYDALIKLAHSNIYDEAMEFECLKIVFIEAGNEKPDVSLLRQWIEERLLVRINETEVLEIVNYVKLLRPHCVLSEYDSLHEVAKKRPLHVNPGSGVTGRDEWCFHASKVLLSGRKDNFIRRRKLSTALVRRTHSIHHRLFDDDDDDDNDPNKKRSIPEHARRLLGIVHKSSSSRNFVKVRPAQEQPLRHSVDAIHYTGEDKENKKTGNSKENEKAVEEMEDDAMNRVKTAVDSEAEQSSP